MYKTPFSDAVESDFPSQKSPHGGEYDKQEVPDTPGKDGSAVTALHRDGAFTGTPGGNTFKTPFKDAIEK